MNELLIITKNMVWVITAILAIGIVILRFTWWRSLKKTKSTRKVLEHGVEAEAIVLSVQPSSSYIDNMPQSIIQLQVQPGKGRNFVTEVQQVLPKIYFGDIHSGSKVIVKYNPVNHKEIVLLRAA